MPVFGEELKRLRMGSGWTQQQLSERLDGQVARSTLANIEVGREQPSSRVWQLLGDRFPEWRPALEEAYEASDRGRSSSRRLGGAAETGPDCGMPTSVGGPFRVELVQVAYVYRHSRAPEEVVESRRVRALRSGADGFVLRLRHPASDQFYAGTEVLWGGRLAGTERYCEDGRTTYLHQVDFGRRLRRGDTHEFAVRYWVERDPEPGPAGDDPAVDARLERRPPPQVHRHRRTPSRLAARSAR